MFSRVFSGAIAGIDAYCVEVEVDCSGGMGQISIVGLPDAAVRESQERVRSAIRACEILMPPGKKWVVNLAPADTRKEGPSLDLPIAVGVLASTGVVDSRRLSRYWLSGELGLDGSVRGVPGVLALAMACRGAGADGLIIPEDNVEEAQLVDGLQVFPVSHLKQVTGILDSPRGNEAFSPVSKEMLRRQLAARARPSLCFRDVKGQSGAKRALTVAAAGRHNLLMVGPPGAGKSMLAERLPSILPPLDFDEALELTKLYSIAGLLSEKKGVVGERPFRSPHHSASLSGLVGGGQVPRPGEVSLAHLGVLFLDEMTEFPRTHLDALRQPLETGVVTISRAQCTFTYPSSFLLVGACNPCPCGHRGDPVRYCICTPHQAERYWARLSGPILDRIDLQVEVGRLSECDLTMHGYGETSETIHLKVMRAVEMQRERVPNGRLVFNSMLSQSQMARFCPIDPAGKALLSAAVTQLGLSGRAYDRVIRVARTIADLEGVELILPDHVSEALKYRTLRFNPY